MKDLFIRIHQRNLNLLFDLLINYSSYFRFEKAVGGSFIGETLRFVLLELIQENLLLQGRLTSEITTTDSVTAIDITMFER